MEKDYTEKLANSIERAAHGYSQEEVPLKSSQKARGIIQKQYCTEFEAKKNGKRGKKGVQDKSRSLSVMKTIKKNVNIGVAFMNDFKFLKMSDEKEKKVLQSKFHDDANERN